MGIRGIFRGNQASSIPKAITADFGSDFDAPELIQGLSVSSTPSYIQSSRGRKWGFLRGSWQISQSKITSTNSADYPISVVDALVPDVKISLTDIGNGAGAALWVSDSGNWWGVGVYQQQEDCNCSTCTNNVCTAYGCTATGCTATGCTSQGCTGGYGCQGTGCTGYGCTATGCTGTGCTGTGCTGYSSSCSGYTKICNGTGCTGYGCKGTGCTSYGCAAYAGTYCVAYGCKSYGCTGGYGCTGYGCNAGYSNYCSSYTNSCSGYGCTGYGCTSTGCTSTGCTQTGCTSVGCMGYGCTNYGCTQTGCTNTGCTSSYSYDYACNCNTCYPAYIRLVQSAANTVSTVTTWAVSQVVKSLRVKTKDKKITVESFSDSNLSTLIQSNEYTASNASKTSKFGLMINPSGYDERKNVAKIKIERNK